MCAGISNPCHHSTPPLRCRHFTPICSPRMVVRTFGNTLSMHNSRTSQDEASLQQNADSGDTENNSIAVFLQLCSFPANRLQLSCKRLQENCKLVQEDATSSRNIATSCRKTAKLQENCNAVFYGFTRNHVLLQWLFALSCGRLNMFR